MPDAQDIPTFQAQQAQPQHSSKKGTMHTPFIRVNCLDKHDNCGTSPRWCNGTLSLRHGKAHALFQDCWQEVCNGVGGSTHGGTYKEDGPPREAQCPRERIEPDLANHDCDVDLEDRLFNEEY
ncbi:hypothetical protein N7449_010531 [Penicillium cf. viridicatum]|uniref:Uncharacterized protein n=1 Tax=Penicillium cf. viridicatum TaxID=2972119 RepID=A0A9W9M526_9EURO|nr:hypothetical protein N7449_010531 [Penicillium cf. viridicatum]